MRDPETEDPVKLLLDTIYIKKRNRNTNITSANTKNSQEFCVPNVI